MNEGVPLWAFLLTALAAVVAPFVTTLIGNKNALLLIREEHANQREDALLEKKYALYEEAAELFGSFTMAMLDAEFEYLKAHTRIQAVIAKLHMLGGKALADPAREAGATLGKLRIKMNQGARITPEEFAQARKTIETLTAAIRKDLYGKAE